MEKKNQKLSKLETINWKLRNFIIFKVIRIFYSRFMMTLAIWFFPKLTYLFSFNNKLPPPKDRIKETSNPLNDWIFKNPFNFENYDKSVLDEEVFVFFKRESDEFKKYEHKDVKKFLINWENTSNGKNIYYATSDGAALSFFVLNNRFPFFYVYPFSYDENKKPFYVENEDKFVDFVCPSGIRYQHKLVKEDINLLKTNPKNIMIYMSNKLNVNGSTNANPGSGITVILALLKIYKKVRIFGLDLYQSKNIHEKSFFYSLLSLSRHFKPIFYQENHMENLIYQYIYLSKIIDNLNVQISGKVSKINLQIKLIKNLKKIIYS